MVTEHCAIIAAEYGGSTMVSGVGRSNRANLLFSTCRLTPFPPNWYKIKYHRNLDTMIVSFVS